MQYTILIHSNPQPWGHPTSDFTVEYAELAQAKRDQLTTAWESVEADARSKGEIVTGIPLGAPALARTFTFGDDVQVTDGPYPTQSRHLAGIFVIDVATQERAEQIASVFACPGDDVELRPLFEFAPQG